MPNVANNFFKLAVVFLVVGIAMGLQMSISGLHNVTGAHAHANLLGWASSAIFGGYYALNPAKARSRLAQVHFWAYAAAIVVMIPSLYLMLQGYAAMEMLVAVSSLLAFAAVLVFAVVVFGKAPEAATERSALAG